MASWNDVPLPALLSPGRTAWWRRVLRRVAYGVVAVFGIGFVSGWLAHGLVSPVVTSTGPTQAQRHDAELARQYLRKISRNVRLGVDVGK